QPLGHAVEPLGVAGYQDQPQAGVLKPSRPVGAQRGGFLSVHRTSCHEDQVGVREPQLLAEIAGPGVVPVAFQSIILDRTGDAYPVARNSQLHEPASVIGVLRRDNVNASKRGSQRSAQAAVSAIAPYAESGVDDRDFGSRRLRRPDQVRPQFQFDEGQHGRPDASHRPPGGPTEVQRCIKGDQVGKGPAGHRQAGRRGRRDDHLPVGTPPGHLTYQRSEQENLANTHGVKPEAGLASYPQRGVTTELLPQALTVLARSDHAVKQHGSEQEQRYDIDQIQSEGHLGESFPDPEQVVLSARLLFRSNKRASIAAGRREALRGADRRFNVPAMERRPRLSWRLRAWISGSD